jgi:predicted Ser/Thr protein kinase
MAKAFMTHGFLEPPLVSAAGMFSIVSRVAEQRQKIDPYARRRTVG